MARSNCLAKWLTVTVAMAVTLMVGVILPPAACGQGSASAEAALHNQRGREYFEKGYYGHAPQGQRAEMARQFGLAESELKQAIATDPGFVDAHRNLARVYQLQKDFLGAQREYRKVVDLAPEDLDAYVNLSLACIELQEFDEAVKALEDARLRAIDPRAQSLLDTYLARLRARQAAVPGQ